VACILHVMLVIERRDLAHRTSMIAVFKIMIQGPMSSCVKQIQCTMWRGSQRVVVEGSTTRELVQGPLRRLDGRETIM
jgi:hypothetical protein